MTSRYVRWLFVSVFVATSCCGMGGLCVSMQQLNLQVQIPGRVNSDDEKLALLRHLEPEGIAEMRWQGEVHKKQLRVLPPQDRVLVDQAFTRLVKNVTRSIWDGAIDWESLPERGKIFVKKQLKDLIFEKACRFPSEKKCLQTLFAEMRQKPDWIKLLFARNYFLLHHGKDVGHELGLSSIGKFSTEELVRCGVLPVDWAAYRPEELRCKDYMIDFKDER